MQHRRDMLMSYMLASVLL